MPTFKFHHVHLLSRDPRATAQYYHKIFDAKITESVVDGKTRFNLDIHGLPALLFLVPPEDKIPSSPPGPYLGLDHFGFLVDNMDEAAEELKRRGAEFYVKPRTSRPGVKIAYIRGPENVRIELLEQS